MAFDGRLCLALLAVCIIRIALILTEHKLLSYVLHLQMEGAPNRPCHAPGHVLVSTGQQLHKQVVPDGKKEAWVIRAAVRPGGREDC